MSTHIGDVSRLLNGVSFVACDSPSVRQRSWDKEMSHLRLRAAVFFPFLIGRESRFVGFRRGAARPVDCFALFADGVRVFAARVDGWLRAKSLVLFGAVRPTPRIARGRPFGRSAPPDGAVNVVMR